MLSNTCFFSLKLEYTPIFSESLKLEKRQNLNIPPKNFKIPKNDKNAELYPNVEHGSAPLLTSRRVITYRISRNNGDIGEIPTEIIV